MPVERVTLSDESPVDSGWKGINSPRMGVDSDGDRVVFKQNTLGSKRLTEQDQREFNVNEIVCSHIMADELGLPVVTYREAEAELEGETLRGLASDYIDGIKQPGGFMSEDLEVLKTVKNTQQAVDQTVAACWLGDWDRVKNNSNMFITKDGQLRAADFGYSLTKGLTVLGIPKANELVMNNLATPENIKPMVDKICAFTDPEIEAMVERVGTRNVKDWSSDDQERITDVLKSNRDQMRENAPFHKYFEGFHPFLKPPFSKATYPIVLSSVYKQKPKLLLEGGLYVRVLKKMASAIIGGPSGAAVSVS